MNEWEVQDLPDDIDAEIDRLRETIDENIQRLLTLINMQVNPHITAMVAGWTIAADERYYQSGDYVGAEVAMLGRLEQPGYISRALIHRAFERLNDVVVEDEDDDD